MYQLLEYFYCLIYVCSLTLCVYKYLDRKPQLRELVLFLLGFGFVDYIVTYQITIDIQYNVIQALCVILSDYMMIALLNRKVNVKLLFYTTLYYALFEQIIVIISFLSSDSLIGLSFDFMFLRFVFIILLNLGSIAIFYGFQKLMIIPDHKNAIANYQILCLVNILAIVCGIVFQFIDEIGQSNIYINMVSIVFIFLWGLLLYCLNRFFILTKEYEENAAMNAVYENVEQYMRQYQEDQQKITKLKHDLKNHLMIMKNLGDKLKVDEYINQILPELDTMVISNELSGNIYIDAILNSKKLQYPNVHISYRTYLEGLHMDMKELCTILFNLVDNACEAANKMNGYVHVEVIYDRSILIVRVKNLTDKKTDFVSRKGKGHGYGLKIVKDIIEKYDGVIEMESSEKEVSVKAGFAI